MNFGRVAKIFVDPKANEAYIADGYFNTRVAVLDASTGTMKRYWGAYGNKPDDADLGPYDPNAPPAKQFRNPVHCADLSKDGLVYVCDRVNDRLQVFRARRHVREGSVHHEEHQGRQGRCGTWRSRGIRSSGIIYVADGINNRVHILQRDTLELLTSFGDGGRQPGQFYGVHSIATDSKGNIYTTETWEGKRLQKFVFKGVGRVTSPNQGVLWPRSTQ